MRAEKPHAIFSDDGERPFEKKKSEEIYQSFWSIRGRQNAMLKGNICSGPAMTQDLSPVASLFITRPVPRWVTLQTHWPAQSSLLVREKFFAISQLNLQRHST